MTSEVGRHLAPSFALIIGIDNYSNYQKLGGAVADAKSVQQHFEVELQVPSDHIRTLYDSEATRDAIIKAFRQVQNDERIQKGDPIVIFYAGHGSELDPPSAWRVKNNAKIQCLISWDCAQHTETEPEVPDEYAPLLDRTIGALIEDIAKAKGDNITVIFDCCHSASGTRHPYIPRGIDLRGMTVTEHLDGPIWRGRFGKVPIGFVHSGLRSHVLLAACGEKEIAYEHDRHGHFTKALLETLRSCAVNSQLTYTEIIERIHLDKQNPQCEGVNRHRVLYDTRVPAGRQVWYPVEAGNGKYVVNAGLSHGIKPGMEITLYNGQKLWVGAILVDDAAVIHDFETSITTSTLPENVVFAKLTRVGKLPLYLGGDSIHGESLREMFGGRSDTANFQVVSGIEEAKLHVAIENEQVMFMILDQRVRRFGLTELPHKTHHDDLPYVLGAAAHYFWYLDLESKHDRLGNLIDVDFFLLKADYDDDGIKFFTPLGKGHGVKNPHPDSSHPSMIDFEVEPKGRYGIEVKNRTKRDLFLNAFLFNHSTLSIAASYTQPSAGKPEHPLAKEGGIFTIGYGNRGTSPFEFEFGQGQTIDVSYLKIFFATRPIDLCDIAQMSPFTKNHPPPQRDRRFAAHQSPVGADVWFTVSIPIVQRKKGAATPVTC